MDEVTYPVWIRKGYLFNLREVYDGLYVGAITAIEHRIDWHAAIDVHGSAGDDAFQEKRDRAFGKVKGPVIRWPILDNTRVPTSLLEAAQIVYLHKKGPMLISCALGMSRSASVAYGLIRLNHGFDHKVALKMVSESDFSRPDPYVIESVAEWVETVRNG